MPNEPQVQRYDASHGVERHELGDYVAWDDYDALAVQVAALTERAERAERECATLRAQLADIAEREAKCCPEDVGFDEYIKRLEAQVAALTERARSAERECAALRADVGFEESILRIHRATSGTDA